MESITKSRIEILLLFILYVIILPRVYMTYDMGFWKEWALLIHHAGIGATYNSTINYFPVFVYGLYFYDLLQGTDVNIVHNINSIKLLFVVFDFLPVFVLVCFRQKLLNFRIPHLFLLLNIAYVFNSMVWGQIDSIYTNLAFLSIIVAVVYPVPALMLYVLAINTKPQAIEFLPVFLLVMIYSVRNLKTGFLAVAVAVLSQMILLLPFLSNGGFYKLIRIAHNTVGLYPKLSICAFNIWYFIARGNPYFIDDTTTYFLVSYRIAGLIMFFIAALLILFPVAKRLWLLRQQKMPFDEATYRLLFLATGMLCLFFFYLNSEMHERYAHPIILFFFMYGVTSGNYKLYVLASIAYFLSLDKCFPDYLPVIHYKFIYASVVIAGWYTLTVVYGSYLFYKTVWQSRPSFTHV